MLSEQKGERANSAVGLDLIWKGQYSKIRRHLQEDSSGGGLEEQ